MVEQVGACQREQVTSTVPFGGTEPRDTVTSIAWFHGLNRLTR